MSLRDNIEPLTTKPDIPGLSAIELDFANTPVETIDDDLTRAKAVRLSVLRLDKVHPLLGGNKWFKLQHNLQLIREQGHHTVLSFGGAYSNHLLALAAAAKLQGLRVIAVIRGELPARLNPALLTMQACGVELWPVSRHDYRRRHDPDYVSSLRERAGPCYVIPEGGANLAGVIGCQALASLILSRVHPAPSHICLPCGTGGTMAGLIAGLAPESESAPEVHGYAVLKGASFLQQDVAAWLAELDSVNPAYSTAVPWTLHENAHFGGYAKRPPELLAFIDDFTRQHGIPLEPVYSGKLMAGIYQSLSADEFLPGSHVLALHTGGLAAGVENFPTR